MTKTFQQNPIPIPELPPAGFIESYDYGAQGVRAMRAFLEGRLDEAKSIRGAILKRIDELKRPRRR